jgi:predicted nucleic acid-binding protein
LTLYVESNFLLEIVLGQEESASAERLLAMAEAGVIDLAVPSFSLSEPVVRVQRGVRDRKRLMKQLNDQVAQFARSAPHEVEVDALRAIPNLFGSIEQRETDRLITTVERLLETARLIELDVSSFRAATDYRTRYALEIEDAIIFALVLADLRSQAGTGAPLCQSQ